MKLPRLYPIVDASVLFAREVPVAAFSAELRLAGVSLVQFRAKDAVPQGILRDAAVIAEAFAGTRRTLIMNDRSDLAVLAGWDGVHVGQDDLPPEDARAVLGQGKVIGLSTHDEAQVIATDAGVADYVAIGPVFTTGTKLDTAAVVGLEFVRRARALTRKPLVAIGGVTRENASSVIAAGADSVAVIGGLFVAGESVEKVARDFLEILG